MSPTVAGPSPAVPPPSATRRRSPPSEAARLREEIERERARADKAERAAAILREMFGELDAARLPGVAAAMGAARALLDGGADVAAGLPRTDLMALNPSKIRDTSSADLIRGALDAGESDATADLLYGASVDLSVFAHATLPDHDELNDDLKQNLLIRVEHRIDVARELHARQIEAYRSALAGLVMALGGAEKGSR